MPEFMDFAADVMFKMEKVGRFEFEVPAPELEFRALEPEVPALEPIVLGLDSSSCRYIAQCRVWKCIEFLTRTCNYM
jgi:hypothetical protein